MKEWVDIIESCNNPVAAGRRAAVAWVPIRDIKFSYMRGHGILKRCSKATELKPLSRSVSLVFFGLNIRLKNATFTASFLKAFVKDFGLKVYILHGK